MSVPAKLVAIHRALDQAQIEHAFGGAIALAYWTLDPRGTRDIDVNVFTAPEECERALAALPPGVAYDAGDIEAIRSDGQVRLLWDDTPVDLFFSTLPIHEEALRDRRSVTFEGVEIPVLAPDELGLFKAMFDRTQDWADIEAMISAQTLDVDLLRARLAEMVDTDDPRLDRLNDALARAARS